MDLRCRLTRRRAKAGDLPVMLFRVPCTCATAADGRGPALGRWKAIWTCYGLSSSDCNMRSYPVCETAIAFSKAILTSGFALARASLSFDGYSTAW